MFQLASKHLVITTFFFTWVHKPHNNHECHEKKMLVSSYILDVGCIYASNPRFKSNISQCHFFSSNLLSNHQNNSKIFSLILLYFYWHFFLCHFIYSSLSTVQRFVYLLPPWVLVLGQGSAYWHIGSTWRFGHPMLKALKGWVSRYMWVRHTHVWPLSSVSTLTKEVSHIAYVQYIY